MAKKSSYRQVARIIDYKTTFGTEEGKRVLHDLMKVCGILTSSYSPQTDSLELAFKEGQRNSVLHILNKLKTDPMELQKFIKERENEDATTNW